MLPPHPRSQIAIPGSYPMTSPEQSSNMEAITTDSDLTKKGVAPAPCANPQTRETQSFSDLTSNKSHHQGPRAKSHEPLGPPRSMPKRDYRLSTVLEARVPQLTCVDGSSSLVPDSTQTKSHSVPRKPTPMPMMRSRVSASAPGSQYPLAEADRDVATLVAKQKSTDALEGDEMKQISENRSVEKGAHDGQTSIALKHHEAEKNEKRDFELANAYSRSSSRSPSLHSQSPAKYNTCPGRLQRAPMEENLGHGVPRPQFNSLGRSKGKEIAMEDRYRLEYNKRQRTFETMLSKGPDNSLGQRRDSMLHPGCNHSSDRIPYHHVRDSPLYRGPPELRRIAHANRVSRLEGQDQDQDHASIDAIITSPMPSPSPAPSSSHQSFADARSVASPNPPTPAPSSRGHSDRPPLFPVAPTVRSPLNQSPISSFWLLPEYTGSTPSPPLNRQQWAPSPTGAYMAADEYWNARAVTRVDVNGEVVAVREVREVRDNTVHEVSDRHESCTSKPKGWKHKMKAWTLKRKGKKQAGAHGELAGEKRSALRFRKIKRNKEKTATPEGFWKRLGNVFKRGKSQA